MKSVIYIEQKEEQEERPIEFTHRLSGSSGWIDMSFNKNDYKKIVYLGSCVIDGDMFACYTNIGGIITAKGHLNSGKY